MRRNVEHPWIDRCERRKKFRWSSYGAYVGGRDAKAGKRIESLGTKAIDQEGIDVLTEVAAYQAKRSSNALQSKDQAWAKDAGKPASEWESYLKDYLEMGQNKAKALGKPYKVAIPKGETLHPKVQAVLDKLGIPVDLISL
jgi:hypothetical protein